MKKTFIFLMIVCGITFAQNKLFTLEDMMSVIEGFITNYSVDPLNKKERQLFISLGELHQTYQNS